MAQVKVLAFGASMTEGFTAGGTRFHPYSKTLLRLLQGAYGDANVAVDQRGQSGEGTESMVTRLPQCLDDAKRSSSGAYTHVVILGGTNDLGGGDARFIAKNLASMYQSVRNHGAIVVAVTLPELAAEQAFFDLRRTRVAVNAAIAENARKNSKNTALLDLATALPMYSGTDEDRRTFWDDDGLHMRPAGYDRFGELVFAALQPFLPTVAL